MSRGDRSSWAMAIVWLALPFCAGPALGAALDPRSGAVRAVASVSLWGAWTGVVVALLVPRPLGLTLLRVLAPAGLAATGAAVATGESSRWGSALALTSAVLALALALAPATGARLVNGAAYGDERRHLLRAPGPLLVGPIVLAWAVLVAGGAAAPLLLAAGRWVAGGVALGLGAVPVMVAARALDALSRRWLVLVPAGVVVKDHLVLADPVLFGRSDLAAVRATPARSGALDLTVGSRGVRIELSLHRPATMPVRGRTSPGRTREADAVLVAPTRPGAFLAEARARRLPVR